MTDSQLFALACGVAAILGHVFSVFVGFKGGKGVATAAGVMLGLTPLALASVGFQLRLSHLRGKKPALGLGLFYKLALGPALIALLYTGIMRGEGPTLQVTLFEAAMPPMISAGIVALDHDLDPPLVTLMLGIGIPLSFLTLPVWFWLLRGV